MEKEEKEPSRTRSPRQRKVRRGNRERSRSPRFSGDEFRISNDTQRNETHLKRARLFVGNIEPDAVSRKDLLDTFSRYGDVIAVSIHNGYAFVQMDSEKNANAAVNLENGRSLNGKKINVEFSSAALKAGARFKRLSFHSSRSPPSRHDSMSDAYLERERRLTRILTLERELQEEMGYLQRESLDYDLGLIHPPPPPQRRHPLEPSFYPLSYGEQSSERGYSSTSRELGPPPERETRQRPRGDYYNSQRSVSPTRGATVQDYNPREGSSSGYRGSAYERSWDNPRSSSYQQYQGGGGRREW